MDYSLTIDNNNYVINVDRPNNDITIDNVAYQVSLSRTGGQGSRGFSAYEVAVMAGFVGTEAQWLDSLSWDSAAAQAATEAARDAAIVASTSASTSATNSAASASTASTSAANALTSKNSAATSATNAATSASDAYGYLGLATNRAVEAGNSANTATNAANTAVANAATATTKADEAAIRATDAYNSASAAGNYLNQTLQLRNESANFNSGASTSATAAANSASLAQTAAIQSQGYADNALLSEENAHDYAEESLGNLQQAISARQAAQSYATQTSTYVEQAIDASLDSAAYAQQAADSAVASSQSAGASAGSAANAFDSETHAANSAILAASKVTEINGVLETAHQLKDQAALSATTATTKAAEAAASAATATTVGNSLAAGLAQFRRTYLGEHATDPVVDGNGDPVIIGAEYFNTVASKLKIYESTGWQFYDEEVQLAAVNTTLSASQAAASASAAATSASNALASEQSAAISQSTATTAATNASTSASQAATSASNASTSASQAATSATNAAASESSVAANALAAANSATESAADASAAELSATNAATSAGDALASATTAANSAAESATNANSSLTSANNASSSANSASTSASAASTSAAQSLSSANNSYASELSATASANSADISEANALSSANASASSATASANSATAAASSATSASTSATNAASSASNASASATAASVSSDLAYQYKQAALLYSNQAYNSELEVAINAEAVRQIYDQFDDRYLGTKTSDPSVDNDGNALVVGTLYFNSTTDKLRVYKSTGWADNSTDAAYIQNLIDNSTPALAIQATGEPMGHVDRITSVISFNNTNRTFSIAPVSTSFEVWTKGVRRTFTSTQSVEIPNTTGLYYIYFNTAGQLSYKTTYFAFETDTPTAYLYWNSNTSKAEFLADERHGVTLDWATHEYLHRTRGAAIASGFSISNYTITGTGALDSDAQIDIGGGTFFDEDLQIDIVHSNTPVANTWQQDLQGPARIPVFRLNGTGYWVMDDPTNFPMKIGTGTAQYNYYDGSAWVSADVSANKYGTSWVIATNNINYPIIAILGQSAKDSLGDAEAVNWVDLSLPGLPLFEYRPLYKVIYQCNPTYTNQPSAKIVAVQDLRNLVTTSPSASVGNDHGQLSGLGDDDHPQYVNTSVARTITAGHTYTAEQNFATIRHTGLNPTEGTAIDQVKTFSQTLTVTTTWQDTSIDGTDLSSGSYLVQVSKEGEIYTGYMSWYSDPTTPNGETGEIVLHPAASSSPIDIFLRVRKGTTSILQIAAEASKASASYTFKFRRML